MLYDPDRYAAACRFAAEAHAREGQKVPGTDLPYLLHVQQVAGEVVCALGVEAVDDPELAVLCALLHDTVEDTDVTVEALAARFGDAVAAGVSALTKDGSLPKPERMADSLRRIRAQPREIWLVKLADRVTNLQPPPSTWTAERRARYADESREILAALGGASPHLAARMRSRLKTYGSRR